MTIRQIVRSLSIAFAKGARATKLDANEIDEIIARAYQEGFEDGIVFKTFGVFPNRTFTIETDENFFKKYDEEEFDFKL